MLKLIVTLHQALDNTYKLGTALLNWSELNVGKVIVDELTIDNDTIQSTAPKW